MLKLSLGVSKGEKQDYEMHDYEVYGFLSICGSTYIVLSDFESEDTIKVREVVPTHQIDDTEIKEFPFYLCQESSPMEKYLTTHFSNKEIKEKAKEGKFIMPSNFPDKKCSRQSNCDADSEADSIMFESSETLIKFDGALMSFELPKERFARYRFLAFEGCDKHTETMSGLLLKWEGPFSLKLNHSVRPSPKNN